MSAALHARTFAIAAHAACGHVRKYTGEPYSNHPGRVAQLVHEAGGDQNMVAAAWLHDVVEDTQVSLELVDSLFDEDIAKLVGELTDVATAADGNRAARVALNRAHTARISARAQTIKLADLIDNTDSIVEHDPEFAKVYLKEKMALLGVLRFGSEQLWQRAFNQVRAASETL